MPPFKRPSADPLPHKGRSRNTVTLIRPMEPALQTGVVPPRELYETELWR